MAIALRVRARKKRQRPEDALQKTVAEWLLVQEVLGRLTFFAVHNNPRNAIDGARLNEMGLRAGMPDLCIEARGRIPLHIELKAPKGRTSFEQVEAMHRLETIGGAMCVVCRSLEDVQKIVTGWLQTKMEKAA
jgi:hypothetical protein